MAGLLSVAPEVRLDAARCASLAEGVKIQFAREEICSVARFGSGSFHWPIGLPDGAGIISGLEVPGGINTGGDADDPPVQEGQVAPDVVPPSLGENAGAVGTG
jgi:hypothetical protein